VFIVRGTRKLLDRVRGPTAAATDESTTALGDWYATVLFWKPQAALFVNESTLLPVLVAFAPAATILDRFPPALATLLRAHRLNDSLIENEAVEMIQHRLATTKNRSVIGIMNEFAHLGSAYRPPNGDNDLVTLSLRLAQTPCGPLHGRHVSPDRELAALAANIATDTRA
jgi:Domain of unknown function (DUF6933)